MGSTPRQCAPDLPNAEVDVRAAGAAVVPQFWQERSRASPLCCGVNHRFPLQHEGVRCSECICVRHCQLELAAAALGVHLLHCEAAGRHNGWEHMNVCRDKLDIALL